MFGGLLHMPNIELWQRKGFACSQFPSNIPSDVSSPSFPEHVFALASLFLDSPN
jgi:hypothetical protein